MSEPSDMRVDPARAQALISQLASVQERIGALAKGRNVCQSPASQANHVSERQFSPSPFNKFFFFFVESHSLTL